MNIVRCNTSFDIMPAESWETMVFGNSSQLTLLLQQWSHGDESVVQELMPLVYQELHRLAQAYLNREHPGHTLQPTALIHEAYIRLIDQGQPDWNSRSHFFRFSAHLMR